MVTDVSERAQKSKRRKKKLKKCLRVHGEGEQVNQLAHLPS